jgi:TonB-dependent receptor
MVVMHGDRRADGLANDRLRALFGGTSLTVLAILQAAPALAQAAPANPAITGEATKAVDTTTKETGDDIVVRGFREALLSAQARKQNSAVVQDSITAEDIGALPDRSVTEALQRIPGVTINRFAAGLDPDHFSVEGSGVVVRGLTYVRSEFNGREAFTANNGRALGFSDVPSELLGGVDVFKSPSADMIEGGIAGTVNLRTRLPFDKPGFIIAGSLENNYGDFVERSSPVASLLVSKTWETGIGRIGILGSLSYSQLFSRADRLMVSSFRTRQAYAGAGREDLVQFPGSSPSREVLFPRGAVAGTQEFDRERYGYSGALQWESTDGRAAATFQFLRSDAREAWTEFTTEIATDNVAGNGDSRAVAGTQLDFDDSGLFESGFITAPSGWRDDQWSGAARTPQLGLQSNNIRRDRLSKQVTSDYSVNFRYDFTDRLRATFDYQHVDSTVDIIDNGLWTSSYQDVFIKMNGSDYPEVRFQRPQNCDTPTGVCAGPPGSNTHPTYLTDPNANFLDPSYTFWRSAMDHIEQSNGKSNAFRIDLDYAMPEGGFLRSVKVGGRYAKRDQTSRFSIYNWGRLSEQWGNGGPVWLNDPVDGTPGGSGGTSAGGYAPNGLVNFFRGQVANPVGEGRLFSNINSARNYQDYIDFAGAINREWEPAVVGSDGVTRNGGWNALPNRPGVVSGTPFTVGEINPMTEENKAIYLMANFDNEFGGGLRLSGNAGIRYTHTKRVSSGYLQIANNPNSIPTEATCAGVPPNQQRPPFCTFTPAERQAARDFLNGALTPNDVSTSYDYLLPSINLKLDVGNGLQFRAAYTKGVAPPEFGLVRNYYNVTGLNAEPVVDSAGNAIPGQYTIQTAFNAGNPYLKPIESDSLDLTAEWYFSKVGQLTGALFYKRLKNVLTNDIQRIDITNNGATFPAIVTTPVNSDDTGTVKGFEIAYQQVFDRLPGFLKGLGLQANYTYVDSNGVPQSTLSGTDPDVAAGRQPTITGVDFPLQGLSTHTVNVTPFIDIGQFSMRLSYNWRSRYLLTIRDVIFPFDPIFQRAYGQLDGSVSFNINRHFLLGMQGVNLLNSVTKTEAAVTGPDGEVTYVPRGWYMMDRRYTIFARFTF